MISERDVDRVARAMTDAEPSGALRARVMDALEPRHIRTAPRVARRVVLNSVLAACAIAAIVYTVRPRPAHDVPQSVTVRQPVAPPVTGSAAAPALTPAEPSTGSRVVRRGVPAEMSAEERAWQSRRLPALPEATPLALEPIQPESLSIAPISVDPIVMDPVVIRSSGS